MSGLIEQVLPEAVRKHLEVLEIELNRPVLVNAAYRESCWTAIPRRHRLSPDIIHDLQAYGVSRVELRINDTLSEFDIEEMVW